MDNNTESMCDRFTAVWFGKWGALVVLAALAVGCGGESSTDGEQRDDEWRARADAGPDAQAIDAGGDAGVFDADGGRADVRADTGNDSDATMGGEGLTRSSVAGGPWYGVIRLTQSPGITGNVQALSFSMDGSVTIGPRSRVTGSWEIFDDDSVRLFDLMRDGEANRPSQYVLEAELDDSDRLAGFELFVPNLPTGDGDPYTARYERIEEGSVTYGDLEGRWRSVETFTGNNGQTQRLELRFNGGMVGYGIAGANGGYFEVFRGRGEILQLDTGGTFWMSLPTEESERAWAPAGEVELSSGAPAAIYAPRAINTDGEPGAEDWEAMRLERISP